MEINGVAAIVSGGASGLGAATARRLSEAGAVVAIFDLDEERGNAQATAIGATFHRVNVTHEHEVARAIAAVTAAGRGAPRLLVNCAGVAPAIKTVGKENVAHPLEVFRRTVEVNLIGTFNLISKFAANLASVDPIGEERGVIVNTASVAAFDGQIGQVAYAASKGGVVSMTLPIARDLAQHLIRVVTIAPGIFMTPMLSGLPEAAQKSLGLQVPHPARLGEPAEFAHLVEAIVTNPMLNGETIRLDGAIRMAPR